MRILPQIDHDGNNEAIVMYTDRISRGLAPDGTVGLETPCGGRDAEAEKFIRNPESQGERDPGNWQTAKCRFMPKLF